jgi:hypothetical protein
MRLQVKAHQATSLIPFARRPFKLERRLYAGTSWR